MNKSSVGRGVAAVEEGGKVFCILRFFLFFFAGQVSERYRS